MANQKRDIFVYAHWKGMHEPKCIGILSAHQAKGRKAFSFEYDTDWISSKEQLLLDPDISWYKGHQYPVGKENFGLFLDSMPDTWGRTLMKRRAAQNASAEGWPSPTLYDVDFLLGVYDKSRMGALRFKLERDGPLLDDNDQSPAPPWSSIRELQHGAELLESEDDNDEVRKWLNILLAPGSSLGGARPKANILDDNGNLWIAKFPSKGDSIDKASWEYLAYKLALSAGIEMSESKIEKVSGKYNTFFTKRFDRAGAERIQFASAMTMTGQNEDTIRDNPSSYLDMAEFIQFNGAQSKKDLHQLWRRISFHIAISNTDDHLRNHGFILTDKGWLLSPAYDINPSIDKDGLALNIDTENNALDFELAISVGEYFQLTKVEMTTILNEIKVVVSNWKKVANEIGISRAEQELMKSAFRF
ncbi:toxin HipA [Flavipsychrobacter stenotrophus]|uniref:Toxin HipA n=1 Tax=Flavipsychrobacter stenotrophus TaxID=2077091 RepID=A0A2S7SPG6_9BACT|nr:HipA domain-containing protein [Flavipsychrobacter stenotrophus]PQJ08780.1 toxin HipA [Flavipsychrobacter stenotrophus]